VYYDLTGLPPVPQKVDAFVHDPDPLAYEKLVDRLLASPRYGECWARHWLDVVHYGDSHGYDKDKPRENAWPYRDYVIRAFNQDTPYGQFVKEQLAGDYFYAGTPDGITALGFIASGPFDFVGQIELREGTLDKTITRNLDRDDMVTSTMNTFLSTTAQCARCHDHKFDPITQKDYYSLQAVFAAVDRADRPYDLDPTVGARRADLSRRLIQLRSRKQDIESRVGPKLAALDVRLKALSKPSVGGQHPQYGYHSAIERWQDVTKWVQVDLGKPTQIGQIVLIGAHDNFANIGAGFGFPVRYKLEASDDPSFAASVTTIANKTSTDQPNPGIAPQTFDAHNAVARYVRLTATKLAPRQNDFILAMAELQVLTGDGVNVAVNQPVSSLDSIEAAPRWSTRNLVDEIYPGNDASQLELVRLRKQRADLLDAAIEPVARQELSSVYAEIDRTTSEIKSLPKPSMVFAAATEFAPSGSFTPTNGKPRKIFILKRGSEKDPGPEVFPAALTFIPGLDSDFHLPDDADESQARAALANWIVDKKNPLTWRSIVNRVWQYHFDRGIVDTPNDFGRMGSKATHPELLDYLAAEFRDNGQSLKALHRLILTSDTYRQISDDNPANAKIDEGNQYLWRMNRHRLDAEAIHDSLLFDADKLNLKMYGPGYRDFAFEDDHSPRYKYHDSSPTNPDIQRRAVYRFIVRSVPQPFMEALDCADPSQAVARRNETLTPLQALAMLNDKLTITMSEELACRVQREAPDDLEAQLRLAHQIVVARSPTTSEVNVLKNVAEDQGLPSACRILFNTNEFVFID
jgi:hypothetical protein